MNTIHGNLEFLDEEKAKWLAKVQGIYASLQVAGRTKTFGGIPGEVQPYGFGSMDANGASKERFADHFPAVREGGRHPAQLAGRPAQWNEGRNRTEDRRGAGREVTVPIEINYDSRSGAGSLGVPARSGIRISPADKPSQFDVPRQKRTP